MTDENRNLHRYRTLRSAQVIDSASGQYYDCTIRDLNSKGAKVKFRQAPRSLGRIEFLFFPENIKVPAVARWLNGIECGVEFLKSVSFLEKHDVPHSIPRSTVATNSQLG